MSLDTLATARAWLRAARRVTVLTGAGISAESGVPTFRDADGLWRRHDPKKLATPEAFQRDPREVMAWYRWRQKKVAACEPNAAHHALVRLEAQRGDDYLLVTQNVDGLHARAGSRRLVTLHGDLYADRCSVCGLSSPATPDRWGHPMDPDDPVHDPDPLRCRKCDGLLRPGVVWFGESLPGEALDAAQRAASEADVLLVIGTSGVVWPAAGLAGLTRRAGGHVVVINPHDTAVDHEATLLLRATAVECVPRLLNPAGPDAPSG
jgi:NAD-dependent deacetylase